MKTTEIPKTSFHDERIDMAYWYPKVRDLDVPTPESQPLPLEHQEDGPPEWDNGLASEIVENLGGEAFARIGYKSAAHGLERGSHIRSSSVKQVKRTLLELGSQHTMMRMPLGESLWLREWLDLNFCVYSKHQLNPEVRAFIRNGEVVCHHPRLEGFEKHLDHKETAEEIIDSAWPNETDHEFRDHVGLETYAERVADEFDGWWSVDFVMDRNGDWYLTDMALDALYERDDEFHGISEHSGDCEHDIKRLWEESNA